jgi:type IV secretory pathway VirB4 component
MLKISLRPKAGPTPAALTPDERRFAHGTRSLADLVAPAAVEVARDHVRLDYQYARTLAVVGYPRTVSPGWLAPLIDFEEPLELSLHVYPLQTGEMVAALTHKMVQLHSSRLLAARGGKLADPEREVAYTDAERLRDALQRGDERIFSVSIYLLLRAGSRAALDDLTRRIETTLAGMLAHSRVALLEQDAGFRSCLPAGRDELLVYRNLDTSSLATLFPFASSSLAMERGVLYGIALHNHAPVIVDPFDESLENANLVVFAKSGAGKSYFTKLMALRNLLVGVDFLVIDPEDEYRALCTAVDGQYIRLASSSRQHLNPFDLPPADATHEEGESPDPLAEHVTTLLGLLELMLARPGPPLSAAERALLDQALYQTYAAAGITTDPTTHVRPAPLLRDLQRTLASGNDELARSLATRLERYVHGSLAGLFSAPTDVALGQGKENPRFVVFNVQSLEPELRPIGIHLIASFVWNQVRRQRRPRLLIIDEAWSLVQDPEGGAFLARMARRARKYYLGLVTITQDVADFLDSEQGRTVLGNAALKLLLKQDSTTIDPVVGAFQLSPEERQLLLGAGKGEGILFARGSHLALRIEASPAEHRVATTAPRELASRAPEKETAVVSSASDVTPREGANGKTARSLPRRHVGASPVEVR